MRWKKHNRSSSYRGGMLLHSLITLVLIISSFVLGYMLGKQRGATKQQVADSTSLEDILKRELSKNDQQPLVKQEKELVEKMATAPSETVVKSPQPSATPTTANGRYTLQFGSFKTENAAQRLKKELKIKNVDANLHKVELGAKGTWWRVQFGSYENEQAAKQALPGVQKKTGKSCLVSKLELR